MRQRIGTIGLQPDEDESYLLAAMEAEEEMMAANARPAPQHSFARRTTEWAVQQHLRPPLNLLDHREKYPRSRFRKA